MNKLQAYLATIKGKNVLIQGLGLNGGGVGTALFFLRNGVPVTITDLKTTEQLQESIASLSAYSELVTFVLGMHREQDFIDADIVVKGPAVNPNNKYIKLAVEHGAEVTSDIEIFYRICECPIYAVTGSKGKSSTVSVIYEIFKAQTPNSFLGGNITISPLSFYEQVDKDSLVILELSSWQLRDLTGKGVRFAGACITNLMNDHQNYYHSMDDYLADKIVITEAQTPSDFILLPIDDKKLSDIKTLATKHFFADNADSKADFYFDGDKCFYRQNVLFDKSDVKAYGLHTLTNVMIGAAFCRLANIPTDKIAEGIRKFKGAPFRLQEILSLNGVKFINDTTATIPEAAISAIKSFDNVIWIGGGNDKELDFSGLDEVKDKPKAIFLLPGDGTDKIANVLSPREFVIDQSLQKLVELAYKSATVGDVVLFSPGATSFGQFANEFDRGAKFNQFLNDLVKNQSALQFNAKTATIVCAGQDYEPHLLNHFADRADIVIAADGGYDILKKCNASPDVILGDMDSTASESEMSNSCQLIKYPSEKDFTDSQLAVEYAVNVGAEEIFLLAGTGSYIDHSLLNIMMCSQYCEKLHIISSEFEVVCHNKSFVVERGRQNSRRFSIFPITDIKNLTLNGAKYKYKKNDISVQDVSVSNEIVGQKLSVNFDSGKMLFILQLDLNN